MAAADAGTVTLTGTGGASSGDIIDNRVDISGSVASTAGSISITGKAAAAPAAPMTAYVWAAKSL